MYSLSNFIKISLLTSVLMLSGCATNHYSQDDSDPLQSYNRAMYSFNSGLDKAIIKPVAETYDTVVPSGISQGISNFFSNLNDVTVIINDLLQFKFEQAWRDTGRFALNTTVGFGGILDVATDAGLEKSNEDFGQTLGAWGVEPGAYVVLPLFGPRNVRDTFGLVGDMFTDPINYLDDTGARTALTATKLIDKRASLLKGENVLNQAALDEYSYVREAYTQKRLNLVYDGQPPEDDFDVFAP